MEVNNAEEFHQACMDKKVIDLQEDIDLTNSGYNLYTNQKLDGNGHTIKTSKPIFSSTSKKSLIENLIIEANITKSDFRIGGLVNSNSGEIINCTVRGTVEADSIVGGIVGVNHNDGTIKNCTSEAEVKGDDCGGIVGVNSKRGVIKNCNSNQENIGKQE